MSATIIPSDHLVRHARVMGTQSRRSLVTRDQAIEHIAGFVRAWNTAHRTNAQPDDETLTRALHAYADGRGGRFSSEARPRLPLRYPRTPAQA